MARIQPHLRLQSLLDSAVDVFVRSGGYRRTKMSAIAEAMGVASGTIFQYVESKEALFNFALRHADLDGPIDPLPDLPIPTPVPGATLQFVRDGVAEARVIASLAAALESDPSDAMTELEAIVGDIYDTMFRNRRGMKLVECCAQDFPAIAMVWNRRQSEEAQHVSN